MADDRESLARLRADIDQIDDELHDLLMRRTLIVRQVAAAKALDAGADEAAPHGVQALAMRPGREARVIRRLVARHSGELPILVIVRLWRELMTAKTRLQAPLSVRVFVGDTNAVGYWDLARFYYGSPTPLIACDSNDDVLSGIAADPSMIGILPAPQDATFSWWTRLKENCGAHVNIVARLPFVVGGEQPLALPLAYVVAPIDPEETGDDRTIVCVESDATVSDDDMRDMLPADVNITARVRNDSATKWLIDVDGFRVSDDPLFVAARTESRIHLLEVLGSFANPLDLDVMKGGPS